MFFTWSITSLGHCTSRMTLRDWRRMLWRSSLIARKHGISGY